MLVAYVIGEGPPGPWGPSTDTTHPTPRTVHALIDHALTQGWNPDAPGGSFTLQPVAVDGLLVVVPSHWSG